MLILRIQLFNYKYKKEDEYEQLKDEFEFDNFMDKINEIRKMYI